MKRQIMALFAAGCLLISLSACRARVDLTGDPLIGPEDETSPTSETTSAKEHDEMTDYAWEVYSAAVEADKAFEQYDVRFEGQQTLAGRTTRTNARLVRRVSDGGAELLVQTDTAQGYYKDGIGYFETESDKYWHVTDESGFLEEMGFSESVTLSKLAFTDAIVAENDDGTRTVSCVLSGKFASNYAARIMGQSAAYIQPSHVEVGVTVDEDGLPIEFTSRVELSVPGISVASYESSNRYLATGDDVTLTPPEGLDGYREGDAQGR